MDLEKLVKEKLPPTAMITKAYYEGAEIVLYTKNKEFFLNGSDKIKELVSELRKRISIRPDPSISVSEADAKAQIMKIIPQEANVQDILFEKEFAKVVILAEKPGMVIGKTGETLREIKQQTLWSPEIQRIPIFKSLIVNKAREIVHEEASYRKQFLNKIGEKIQMSKGSKEGWVRITALGAFREVGRSCVFLQTKQSKVILDCGVAVGNTDPHPLLDAPEFDIEALDAVIISHAHLDHSGFAPYLYEYGYKGPIYTTLPTRDLMTLLQLDFIDVLQKENGTAPYTSKGIKEQIKHSISLDYGEVCDITPDMRLTFQNAGHILGSAQSHIHIGEGMHNFVYTGDMKYGVTKLLEPAYTGFTRVETLLVESTYGGMNDILPHKKDADANLIKAVIQTVKEGGKVIIPAFSVGRAQEVMMVLADAIKKKEIEVPVYLDGMIWNATAIHTTYPEFLSSYLQKQIFHQENNPFTAENFKQVSGMTERQEAINDKQPAVILTTSGMVTGGPVMEYIKQLADNPKNLLVFVGYQAEGTLGNKIQKGWRELPFPDGKGGTFILKMQCKVETVEGFSGHSDRTQLMNYISHLRSKPQKIMFNHGNPDKSINIASAVHKRFRVETLVPSCLDAVRLR